MFTRTWNQIFPGRPRPGNTIGRVAQVVTHTEAGADLPATATVAQELARLRGIDAYHRSLGWAGFGYSSMTCQSGRVYQGRGGRRSGAHTQGINSKALAHVVPGHGDRTPMSEACITGARRWMAYEIADGALAPDPTVTGHRDHATKSCPGNRIYPQLGRLRGVGRHPTTPAPVPEEDDDLTPEQAKKLDEIHTALGLASGDRPRRFDDDARRLRLSMRALGRKLGLKVDPNGNPDQDIVA